MKVAIIGLKPNQAERIEHDYGGRVDLKFVRAETPPQQIKATAESSDVVVLMTKFVPHEAQQAVRKHPGTEFCNGGISAVGARLDQLLEKN